ncbi:MAG: hypothetical protein DRO05_07945 [Thermoproteota archaeon]|nr:MAG: hypothetical protein DRO05_07945 [Candidatus Korarchaeota archaeon]
MYALSTRSKRTRYEVYADLLNTIRMEGGCTITRASYGARIPVDRANRFLHELIRVGLVRVEEKDGSRIYKVTIRGIEFLELFSRLKKLLGEPLGYMER